MPGPRDVLAFLLLSTAALATPTATEGCVLKTSVALPSYHASQESRGTFEVHVHCDDQTVSYQLNLSNVRLTGAGDAEVSMPPGATQPLSVRLMGVTPMLTGKLSQGDLNQQFALVAPSGQWKVPAGLQSLRIDLTLTPGRP